MMADHVEIFVKVNARVDSGVAPLVDALSSIPGLETLESCQGDPPDRMAYVFFRLGSWRDIGALLFDRLLSAIDADLRADVSLSMQAYDTDHARGRIAVRPAAIPALVDAIEAATDNSVRLRFNELKDNWKSETAFLSSISDIVLNFNYQMIIGIGPDVLPLIMEEMKAEQGHWFWALKAIAGVDPVPPEVRGDMARMTHAWLEWLEKNV